MRTLLLTSSFPPTLGGIETLLWQTNRRLAEPPLVLAPALAPAAAEAQLEDRMPVQRVKLSLAGRLAYRPLWHLHPSLHYVQTFWRPALAAAATWQPRAIQVGHVYLAPLGWLLARRLKVPYLVYAYGQEVWRGGRAPRVRPLDAQLRGGALRAAHAVLVPGEFTARLLTDWQVCSARIVAVPYGADLQPDAAVPPEANCRLLTVARLIPRKGIDSVIRALPSLPAEVEYRVVGHGPDLARLRSLAGSLGVDQRVRFLGRLDEQALAQEYRRCSLFVLPARRTTAGELEGYGLVYFEAAAWGRPVVAGRSGGEVDAVVDGQTGLLVDGESVAELSRAITALLADPARMRALGAAGRQRVETSHNWQSAAAVVDATLSCLA